MPASNTAQTASASRILTGAAHAAFVPIGVVTVLLGPLLPWLSARWSLDYAQAGSLFTAQFAASTLGVALSSIFIARRGFRFAINAGLLIMAVAVAALPYGSRLVGSICVATYGFGMGISIPAANLLVAEVNPDRRSAALNLLNFSWSVGAVACPFLVAAAIRLHRTSWFLGALAAAMIVVMAGIAVTSAGVAEPSDAPPATVTDRSPNWRTRILQSVRSFLHSCRTDHSFVVLCALFFLYVGTENAVGGWVASYARSLKNAPVPLALMTPSFFYTALMLGRWLAPLALRTIDEIKLSRAGILMACIGIGGLVSTRTIPGIMVAASIAGLGLSSVYPITISLLARQFGPAASRVGSTMFVMANLGGAFLPWLVGYCSTRFGAIQTGLVVPLVAGVAMLGLYFAKWKAHVAGPERDLKAEAV
ncbi:MAG TPA: MFS transporter [Candidatus Aquilonibacter sp.]|nr:MFS transporter [Candidatus Aquilonibacter sp.]